MLASMSGRLVIIGSGETSPTMVKVHRALMASSSSPMILDTPYGFQVNADDLSQKISQYFGESVGVNVEVGRWRRKDDPVAERERTLAMLAKADWVFAGPGSPSYALHQWAGTDIPAALNGVLQRGGTVVLGSAAAVTSGAHAIPVYEVYKVGADPYWLDGLDLLDAAAQIKAAIVPHYDNKEGGRHDTRFCYLGEVRLEALEAALPQDVGVLGVDEHTAVVIDTGANSVAVHGNGGLTLRYRTRSEVVSSGEAITIADLRAGLAGARVDGAVEVVVTVEPPVEDEVAPEGQPSLVTEATALRERFDAALATGDADEALAACLDLEDAIHAWSTDTLTGSDMASARRVLRSMLVDLAGAATTGLQDPKQALEPVMQVVLEARRAARANKDYAMSDQLRDGLAAAGIEVRDTPDGVVWELRV